MEKSRKRKCRGIKDSDNEDFEGFDHDPDNVSQNNNQKSIGVASTLNEIKKSMAQIMSMKSVSGSSCDSQCKWPVIEAMLKDVQESIDYLISVKNDMEEVKLSLIEMNSKLNAIIESQESSSVNIHGILTSIPYTTLTGAEKVEQHLGIATIFEQIVSNCSRNRFLCRSVALPNCFPYCRRTNLHVLVVSLIRWPSRSSTS